MVAAEFSTLRSVKVLTASCGDLATPDVRGDCVTKGHDEHSYALVLLGIAAAVMGWGAAVGRSRPAGAALVVLGAAVLAIALVTDVPDLDQTGVIGERYDSATAEAGPGLWLEIAGGALVLVAGAIAASVRPKGSRARERERERRRAERQAKAEA